MHEIMDRTNPLSLQYDDLCVAVKQAGEIHNDASPGNESTNRVVQSLSFKDSPNANEDSRNDSADQVMEDVESGKVADYIVEDNESSDTDKSDMETSRPVSPD